MQRRRRARLLLAAVLTAAGLAGTAWPTRAESPFVDVVTIDAKRGDGVMTAKVLEQGVEYLLVATGVYTLGPGITGDSECTAVSRYGNPFTPHRDDVDFAPHRYGTGEQDLGDVFVDYRSMPWRSVAVGEQDRCSPEHTYTTRFRPAATGRQNLLILDNISHDNSGELRVTIYRTPPECEGVEGCEPPSYNVGDPPPPPVPPVPPLPPVPPVPLPPIPPPPPVPPVPPLPPLPPVPLPPQPEPPVPLPPVGNPSPPDDIPCCVEGVGVPPNYPVVSGHVLEVMTLVPSSPNGARSHQVYQRGRTYEFIVQGAQSYNGLVGPLSDAECSQGAGDPTWSADRFGSTELDLTLNGYEFTWLPLDGTGPCDEQSHAYRLTITPDASGSVLFKINESGSVANNHGIFTITAVARPHLVAVPNPIPHITGSPLDTLVVDSRDPFGAYSSLTLRPDTTYTVAVSGRWSWGGGTADAECSTTDADPIAKRDRFDSNELDLAVNGAVVDWQPVGATVGERCDPGTAYWTTFKTPSYTTYVWFGTWDTLPGGHDNNAGGLTVSIYR